jgi:5'-methylthioadenosine phosphorylase
MAATSPAPTASASSASHDSPPALGVIGGSGFYEFLDDPDWITVETPFGKPASPVAVGTVGDRFVAFLPRHGRRHEYPPHRVNYRANIWALRSLGVRRVLAPCAVGSLQPALGPGDVVIPDQLMDRTSGRIQTFMDDAAVHVGFADPYCPRLRSAVLAKADSVTDGGTLVVIEGPRFSTRAESQWYSREGWSIIGMTTLPEAALARELGLCYATVALVTDRDAGVEGGESVSHAEVLEEFARNIGRLRELLAGVLAELDVEQEGCSCAHALDGLTLPFELP